MKQALDWLLHPARLAGVTLREDGTWTPKGLIFAALLGAWSDETALTDRFARARKVVVAMGILSRSPARSYPAFLKLLRAGTVTLTVMLPEAFRARMRTERAERSRGCGDVVCGVDGRRLERPRTESHERRYAPAPARRKRPRSRRRARSRAARAACARATTVNSPQRWLTVLVHVGTGLPGDGRTGPSDRSERDHLRPRIDGWPADARVTADAGFVGSESWKALRDSGRHFLIRVGANVRLLKRRGDATEKDGVVFLGPARAATRGPPPLVLRRVVVRGGRHPVYLVTSVRDEGTLPEREVARISALRWGVELFYRHFQPTFERRTLRSHAADNAELEAAWSLLGLWAWSRHGQVEWARAGVPARRVSVAGLLFAYRRSLREYQSAPDPGESLRELVLQAVIDPYRRANKASRDYPRKKQNHATGAPKIQRATRDQINAARRIRDQLASRLTA